MPRSHETHLQPAFGEVSVDEVELSLLSPPEIYQYFHDELVGRGYDPADLLYTGIDSETVRTHKTFGNRRETWAVTDKQFATIAAKDERIGSHSTSSPPLLRPGRIRTSYCRL